MTFHVFGLETKKSTVAAKKFTVSAKKFTVEKSYDFPIFEKTEQPRLVARIVSKTLKLSSKVFWPEELFNYERKVRYFLRNTDASR